MSRSASAAVLSLLLFSASASAQTTGSINGTITDNTGAVLPGVRVTATSPAMMGTQVAVSNEQGVYRFPALPTGTYALKFELSGFATVNREGIIVTLGFTATVNVQAAAGGVAEAVTVTGESPVVDVKNTNIQTNVTQQMLKDLPNSRDIWTVIGQSPGFMVSNFDVGGSRAGTQTGLLGVRLFRPGARAGRRREHDRGHRRRRVLLRLRLLPGNAARRRRHGRVGQRRRACSSTRIMKSGGNQFKGDFYFDYENKNFQGNNVTDELRRVGVNEGTRMLRLSRPQRRASAARSCATSSGSSPRSAISAPATTVDGFPVENPERLRLRDAADERHLQAELPAQPEQPARATTSSGAGSSSRTAAPAARRTPDAAVQPGQLVVGGEPRLEQHRSTRSSSTTRATRVRLRLAEPAVRHQRRAEREPAAAEDREPHRQQRPAAPPAIRTIACGISSTGPARCSRTTSCKGNHALKFGWLTEWETQEFTDYGFVDDRQPDVQQPRPAVRDFTTPFRVTLRNTAAHATTRRWHHAAFLTDQWQINPARDGDCRPAVGLLLVVLSRISTSWTAPSALLLRRRAAAERLRASRRTTVRR